MPSAHFDNISEWIETIIAEFMDASGENRLENTADDKAFDAPLVGFSRGDDSLYEAYKEYVGPFHWTPQEVFKSEFPTSDVKAGQLTVVSWILPHIRATKRDNRTETFFPAERWARARIFGEEVNVKLRKHLIEKLCERGIDAVAPALRPNWEMKKGVKYVFASTWSERHAAHASGLGTFGLCDGLITPKGKAVRVGSVVAAIEIPATPRPYDTHHAYCLFLNEGSCGKCISRCPVGAVSEAGHDKLKCFGHLRSRTAEYVESNFGFKGYGCGLCQTGVPCESSIPKSRKMFRRSETQLGE
jgi:epoxyqueuosine reductase QueG